MKALLVSGLLLLFHGFSDAQTNTFLKAQAAAGTGGSSTSAKVDFPPRIDPFMKIPGRDHPGLGAYIVGLGDVNGDGYGDFAVSSELDTTFIFFGGPNLDDKADLFVLGGGAGILAGDINGDGYTDLITSQKDFPPKLDPDRKGLVRIYLHNHGAGAYNAQPDLQMTGKNQFSGFGAGGATHILGGDVNGDGKLDLLIEGYNDKTPNGRGIVYLYLGSATPDTIPDFQFMDTHGGEPRQNFGEVYLVTDINGDGFDDVLIEGMGKQQDTNEEIHLGNPAAQFGAPYEDVKFQDPFKGANFPWAILDIDGNGCPEIFPLVVQQYPPFGWGKCGPDFPKQMFQPDTIFPNPDPANFDVGMYIAPIRRFSGSIYQDYVMLWGAQSSVMGFCWIYQSGPGWQTTAVGYYELHVMTDGVGGLPFPLGDVTGDNIDDFALITGNFPGIGYPLWIFKGDRRYKLTGVDSHSIRPASLFNLYPNPVTSFDARRVYMQGNLAYPSTLEITVYDLLGRSIARVNRVFETAGPFQIPLELHTLVPGNYFVSIEDGENRYIRSLVILSH